ncbi:MAG TPA: hypothetical protein VFR81_19885 [Longimicrobium sp.]|nr:hypothetical protein [Longimicrobium sp.]
MRLRLAAILVPLALSACATYGYPGGGGRYDNGRGGRWEDYDTPLFARLEESGSGLGIRLNRPAHVAVFEIVPGQGVGLVYPGYSREAAYFPSGFSYVQGRSSRSYDWYNASYNHRGYNSRNQPRFYFLVASREPLRTRGFHSGGSLRSVLGMSSYSTVNYRTVMHELVQAVVPYQHDDDWTTDVLAVWPDRRYDRYWGDRERYTQVRCRNGTVVLAPWELSRYACGGGRRGNDGAPPLRPDHPGRDSTKSVEKPTRRRPDLPTTGGTRPGTQQVEAPRGRPGLTEPAARPRPQVPDDGDKPRARPGVGEASDAPRAREVPRVREQPRNDEPRREAPRVRDVEERRAAPRERPQVRETPREEPRRSEPVRSAEPRRSDPPPRAEPRSESPKPDRPSRGRDDPRD